MMVVCVANHSSLGHIALWGMGMAMLLLADWCSTDFTHWGDAVIDVSTDLFHWCV